MRILSGNSEAPRLTPEQRQRRKNGMKFGAWVMEQLRGAEAVVLQEEASAHRPKCPFYGFVGMAGAMMDSKGNACALTMAHRPCPMEQQDGQAPCWDGCIRWNNDRNREALGRFLSSAQVFPDELAPKDGSSWKGISGTDWFRRVMGRSYS